MGKAFLAQDTSLDRKVAIQDIDPQTVGQELEIGAVLPDGWCNREGF